MKVLGENRRILANVGLDADNDAPFLGKLIPRQLIAALFGSALFSGILVAVLLILNKYQIGPAALIFPVGLLISCTSLLLVYISLFQKRRQMRELFDYLQTVADKSNANYRILIGLTNFN